MGCLILNLNTAGR